MIALMHENYCFYQSCEKTLKTLNEVKNHILLGSEGCMKAIVATHTKNIFKISIQARKDKAEDYADQFFMNDTKKLSEIAEIKFSILLTQGHWKLLSFI